MILIRTYLERDPNPSVQHTKYKAGLLPYQQQSQDDKSACQSFKPISEKVEYDHYDHVAKRSVIGQAFHTGYTVI